MSAPNYISVYVKVLLLVIEDKSYAIAWSSLNSRANKPVQNSSSIAFFERNVQDMGEVVIVSESFFLYIRLAKLLVLTARPRRALPPLSIFPSSHHRRCVDAV